MLQAENRYDDYIRGHEFLAVLEELGLPYPEIQELDDLPEFCKTLSKRLLRARQFALSKQYFEAAQRINEKNLCEYPKNSDDELS
jgi:hypothetical protein